MTKRLEDYLPKSSGLAHLDPSKCQLTDDPEYPLVYTNEYGVVWRIHRSRVIHVTDSLPTLEDTNS